MSGVTISPSPSYLTNANVNLDNSGSQALVAAVTGAKVRLYRIVLNFAAANTVIIQDGSTSLIGPLAFGANGSMVFDNSGDPWATTSSGNALNLSVASSAQIGGMVSYLQTPNPPIGG